MQDFQRSNVITVVCVARLINCSNIQVPDVPLSSKIDGTITTEYGRDTRVLCRTSGTNLCQLYHQWYYSIVHLVQRHSSIPVIE